MRTRFIDTVDFWRFLLRRFLADQGPNNAAALTYTTLFAVVPMMTVTFAMLSAVPAFQNMGELIQSFIFRNFVPTTGSAIEEYLRMFTVQARQLTWVGIAFLLVTALLMLLTIEKVFNTIWRVHQTRRGITSFLIYWAILSLGPLLLGAGFALSTYIASLSLISGPHPLIGAGTLLKYMPLLLSVAAFTLLYAAVPNTRVPLGHALVGGVFAAVLFEAAKKAFSFYVGFFPGYQLIYGAFATVPLFLLWIYLSWIIVLLGAELVCNLSSSREWRNREVPRLLAVFGALRVFHQRQQSGRPVRHADMRSAGWPMPEDEWVEVVEFLESEQLVCRTSGGAWVLCRDLSRYPVHQLIRHSPWPLPRVEQLPDKAGEHWLAPLRDALAKLHEEQVELFGDDLASWLQPAAPRDR